MLPWYNNRVELLVWPCMSGNCVVFCYMPPARGRCATSRSACIDSRDWIIMAQCSCKPRGGKDTASSGHWGEIIPALHSHGTSACVRGYSWGRKPHEVSDYIRGCWSKVIFQHHQPLCLPLPACRAIKSASVKPTRARSDGSRLLRRRL